MKNIKYFLKEQTEGEGQKLKHIEHLEDLPLNSGKQGLEQSVGALRQVQQHIKAGRKNSDLTMKHDGSPSIVYGHHPSNGKFFVASKSAFNKTPKINYTDDDIQKNHGHAPGLVEKLKAALHHLPKIVPPKGVYQGDVLFTHNDIDRNAGKLHFRPNTIKYSVPEKSTEGQKINKAKLGLYTHTEYRGKDSSSMNAHFDPELGDFKNHPDVYHREPGHDTSKVHLSDESEKNMNHHINSALAEYSKHGDNMFGSLDKKIGKSNIKDHVKTYINSTVRTGETPSPEGLSNHLIRHYGKQIDSLKTDKSKNAKADELKAHLNHVENNKEHFNGFFKMHHHLQQAKNVLVNTLSKDTGGLEHRYNNKKVKPEGFVVNHKGTPIKLNDRAEFNKLNFERSAER